jgi:hypothetical protein
VEDKDDDEEDYGEEMEVDDDEEEIDPETKISQLIDAIN